MMMTSTHWHNRPKRIFIDIETYSSQDLAKCGVYHYAESEDFEILLFSYSFDGQPVEVIDLQSGQIIPDMLINMLCDDTIEKWAFNAQFERICLSRYIYKNRKERDGSRVYLKPNSWYCTMVYGAYCGLPLSLKEIGTALGLQRQKLESGKELIRYFCKPCTPTKSNNNRTRNHWYDDSRKWEEFKYYNKRDVEVEIDIHNKLESFDVPQMVWDTYHIDQQINDKGVRLDLDFVNSALAIDSSTKDEITQEMKKITQLENPNSVMQLMEWLSDYIDADDLSKDTVKQLLQAKDLDENVRRILELRQQLAKSSVKKYTAMANAACDDLRARGMFQYYGANRSGRWAGRLIQLQNLPQNHLDELEYVRSLVKERDMDTLEMLYESIPDVLSQLIRTSFVPSPGNKFIVADFSAIEARVLAWLAGEQWRMDLFKEGGDIYCQSASNMFGVPVVKHGINGHLRQKGKVAELACGYGGSSGALISMGALKMGLTEDELTPLVNAWRASNPNIVKLWWDVDKKVKECVAKGITTKTHGITFRIHCGTLQIELPSGRCLTYVSPRFKNGVVSYMGIGATKKFERIDSYGPKFVENIVQGISRDILANSMHTLKEYDIVMHIHDELVIDCPMDTDMQYICEQMSIMPDWAKGLINRADGYECMFYQKD